MSAELGKCVLNENSKTSSSDKLNPPLGKPISIVVYKNLFNQLELQTLNLKSFVP